MTGWERASRCECAACVEVDVRDDVVLVRDSKHPDGPVLEFTLEEWRNLTSAGQLGHAQQTIVHVNTECSDGYVTVARVDSPDFVLKFTREEWAAFVDGVRGGEFDVPAPIPPGDR